MIAIRDVSRQSACPDSPAPGGIAAWTGVLKEQDAQHARTALRLGQAYTHLAEEELTAVAALVAAFGLRPMDVAGC